MDVLSDVNEYNGCAAILAQGQGCFSSNRGIFNNMSENLTAVFGNFFCACLLEQCQDIIAQVKVGFLTEARYCFGYVGAADCAHYVFQVFAAVLCHFQAVAIMVSIS